MSKVQEQIVSLRKRGWSNSDIASELGVNQTYASRVAGKHGLTRAYRRKRKKPSRTYGSKVRKVAARMGIYEKLAEILKGRSAKLLLEARAIQKSAETLKVAAKLIG